MAFGDTAVLLSSFSGSDENPLSEGGNWAKLNTASLSNLRIVSHQVTNTEIAPNFGDCHFYWTPANFGPDVDVYFTVGAFGSALDILLRISGQGGSNTFQGYWLQVTPGIWGLFKVSLGTSSLLLSTAQATAAGNKIGLGIGCSTLSSYINTGAGWTLVQTVTDLTYDHVGPIAFGCAQNTDAIDDVFAGTVPRTTPCTPTHQLPILGVGA